MRTKNVSVSMRRSIRRLPCARYKKRSGYRRQALFISPQSKREAGQGSGAARGTQNLHDTACSLSRP